MKTVKQLREELAKFKDDDFCHAYEGEVTGIVVSRDGKQGVIYCSEGEDAEPTETIDTTPRYSQGVCEDGAAILCDGERMTVDEIVSTLNVQEKLFESYKSVVDAIPECPAHGPCVPHCLDWIEAAKRRKR